MALTLRITSEIPDNLIRLALEMDHAAYEPVHWVTEERANMIYRTFGDSLILLEEDGEVIGYMSVFPIAGALAEQALRLGRPIYEEMRQEHLTPAGSPGTDIYLHNIILLPQYRGLGYSRFLLEGLRRWLLLHPGCARVWGDVVSEGGRRVAESLGMTLRGTFSDFRLFGGDMANVMSSPLFESLSAQTFPFDIALKHETGV